MGDWELTVKGAISLGLGLYTCTLIGRVKSKGERAKKEWSHYLH